VKIAFLFLVLTLAACTVAAPPPGRGVPAARSLAESLPTPNAPAQPALAGALWADAAMGDLWRFDLAAGTSERLPRPDGARFAQPALTSDCAVQAWLTAAAGSDRFGVAVNGAPVLTPTDVVAYDAPALTPDGRALFAARTVSNAGSVTVEIVRLALEPGGVPQPVAAAATQPAVAPNGARLVYVAFDTSRPPEVVQLLRVRSLDGGGDAAVLPDGRFFEIYGPRWLDDERIVFAALERGDAVGALSLVDALFGRADAHARPAAHARAGHVWVVNADGSDLRRLTAAVFEAPILAPSPDGRHIALLSEDVLHVMNADGSDLRRLAAVGGSGGLAWCR